MFYEKFQVFGIHIYLQDPKELLCTAISNVKQRQTTTEPEIYPTPIPPRTFITALEDKPISKNSENYAIEAFGPRSSGIKSNPYECLKAKILVILVINIFCLKYFVQR
jgi:hypothetical protein